MTDVIYQDMMLEHLDFDYQPPCDFDENTAEYVVTMPCCGQQFLICDVTLRKHAAYVARSNKNNWTRRCKRCHTILGDDQEIDIQPLTSRGR